MSSESLAVLPNESEDVCMGVDIFFFVIPNDGRWGQQCAYQSLRSRAPALWACWGDIRRCEESDPPIRLQSATIKCFKPKPKPKPKPRSFNLSHIKIMVDWINGVPTNPYAALSQLSGLWGEDSIRLKEIRLHNQWWWLNANREPYHLQFI